ncbi:MAG: LPS export ABC transporter periplasmic protein LptC [Nevskia sp.]|nr:LPS export ABC transporter periplasmic protein LptC [Nevskia sp.]
MNWRRPAIALLLAAAMAGLLYTFQRMDSTSVQVQSAPGGLPRYTLADAELTRFDSDGSPTLLGQAATIEYFDDQSGRAQDLQADLIADGDKTWHLTSPAATLPAHQHRFMLEGPVLASGQWPDSGDELTVRTQHLWVDPDRHEIDTDAPVDLQSPSRTGSAVGMRADWTEQSMQLQRNVKMSYEPPR